MKLYSNITLLFGIWLLAIFVIAFISFSLFPHDRGTEIIFWESFENWDGGHFIGISKEGYSKNYQYAFFPLYPLLINIFTKLFPNEIFAGLLVSLICAFFSLQFLYKLILLDFDKTLAERTVINLLIFPSSFFLTLIYSESLYLLLVILVFYCFRLNKIFWATIFVALSCLTRLVGVTLLIVFWFNIISQSGLNRKNWFVVLSLGGILAYLLYLYNKTGDPIYFIIAEEHWQRNISAPWISFKETINNIINSGYLQNHITVLLDWLFSIFGLGMVLRSLRFLPSDYFLYGLLSLFIPLLTASLVSMPRFLISVFPIFVLASLWKNKYLIFIYQLFSALLLSLFIALYFNGYWIS